MDDISKAKPQLQFLTQSQCEQIHRSALEILRRTGVRVHNKEALKLLSDADCVLGDDNLVYFPPSVVEWALQQPPSEITLCFRGSGKPAAPLYGNNVNFGTGSDCPNIIDPRTGNHRAYTLDDLEQVIRFIDSIPELAFTMSTGIPSDYGSKSYRKQFSVMIKNTVKPVVFVCDDGEDCRRIISSAAEVAGGLDFLQINPTLLLYSEPSTPLQQSESALEKLLVMAESKIPVVHSPAPMMAGTAPVTLAGGLAVGAAEALSGLVIHQLKQPGAPFVFGSGLHHLDMRTSISVYGAPEFQLARLAVADLGRYYDLPTWGYAGHSDACIFDEQAASDSLFSVMNALLSGTNLVHDVGYLEAGLSCSPEMIVYTAEMISMLRHFKDGFTIDSESLALNVIHSVGPGGNYMTEDHTLERFRGYWDPRLYSRSRFEAWQAAGSRRLGERLREKTISLLDNATGTPLKDSSAREVDYILELTR